MLADNIRASDLVLGDMEAQIAAARIGAEAFLRLIERHGLATVQAACSALMDYSERMMRHAIEALPDGQYRARSAIDGFLDDDDPARRELPIEVTVAGSDIAVDFSGTARQVDDRPINMPLHGTADCAVWMTLRSILLDSAMHGRVPLNAGLTRPIRIVAPRGTLVNPTFPAPTIARACPGIECANTIMKALAQAVPGQVSAGVGNLNVVAYAGLRGESHWVHMEIYEDSYGGRAGKDGTDAMDILFTNTRNNPIEDVESYFPLRIHRYELRDGVCAAGRWRGGIGPIRETELLEDAGFSIEGEGQRFPPALGPRRRRRGPAQHDHPGPYGRLGTGAAVEARPHEGGRRRPRHRHFGLRRLRRPAAAPAGAGAGGCRRRPHRRRSRAARLRGCRRRCARAGRCRHRAGADGPCRAELVRVAGRSAQESAFSTVLFVSVMMLQLSRR